MKSWHTIQERKVIRKYHGKHLVKYGYDGLLNGRPVEVRSVREDSRYRLQKNIHRYLIRKNGSYIFVNKRCRTKRISAKKVSGLLGNGNWFFDRKHKYDHRFLTPKKVFNRR